VRGGEEAALPAVSATNRVDHGADGSFAVGPCNVNDPLLPARHFQLAQEALDVLEPELDSETLGSVKPGERFAVGHWLVEK
jgi:hypothetical protein